MAGVNQQISDLIHRSTVILPNSGHRLEEGFERLVRFPEKTCVLAKAGDQRGSFRQKQARKNYP